LIYAHTITQSCIKRAMFERAIYEKQGPGRRKFIDGGLFGALDRAGAWTRAGAGVEKQNAPPRAIDRGRELWRGPAGFEAPEAP